MSCIREYARATEVSVGLDRIGVRETAIGAYITVSVMGNREGIPVDREGIDALIKRLEKARDGAIK